MHKEMLETLTTISDSHRYNQWIYAQFREHLSGCVLDIGSGIGDIAKHYIQEGNVTKVILTDYSEDMVVRLRKKFGGSQRFEVLKMDIVTDDCLALVPPGSVDVITCSNVLEHIEDDGAVLVKMRQLLKPGGKLLILVPALPAIYGTLDRLVGHYRRYTRKSLRAALEKSGFTVQRQFYMNMFGVVTWFMAGRVLKHRKFDQDACKTLDRVVPALRFLESGVKPLWGQSLIAVSING
jgi:SAM-dependent methyltransferase